METLTTMEVKEIKEIFNYYDTKNIGYLKDKELRNFIDTMTLYFQTYELANVIHLVNSYNDGHMYYKEFLKYILEDV